MAMNSRPALNHKNRTIELTKKFSKQSSIYGTDEYRILQEVRRDYPDYRITVSKAKNGKSKYDGLNFTYMEKYIKQHDDASQTDMREYLKLRGYAETGELVGTSLSLPEIRDWFLDKYPTVEKFLTERAKRIEDIRKKRANKKDDKKPSLYDVLLDKKAS